MEAVLYCFGEYREVENVEKDVLRELEELSGEALLGFDIRREDRDKAFYADPDYIDEGADGISVKYAYAIDTIKEEL